jgi:uncharacterized protein YbjT (DUF2867 family)
MHLTTMIAIVGASGTLGSLVRARLEGRGHQVAAVPRGDAGDAAAIARLGAESIIDCAGASTAMALGHGWRGFRAVDTRIGMACARAAEQTGARMVYVATHFAPPQRATPYVDAHERVIAAMPKSSCTIRATGFFAAFAALVPMARRGVLVDVGGGSSRTNPIDERDLADIVAEHAINGPNELVVGGPEIMSRREIFERVAAAARRRVRIVRVPVWLARCGTAMLSPLHPRIAQFGRFACGLARHDVIGDAVGTRRLDAYLAASSAMLR